MRILIVVDMQNDLIDGPLGTKQARAIVPKVKGLIDEFVLNEERIIFTRETHYDNYLKTQEGKKLPIAHCIKNTDGWKISSVFERIEKLYTVIDKETFGCIDFPAVIHSIVHVDQEINEIVIAGLLTDICVVSNALILKAAFPETKISVAADCCAGTSPENHDNAIAVMRKCQVDII
ncbi:MAG: isochorismatase family cysteine hydrolase [Anaerovoracaceae bacterium]